MNLMSQVGGGPSGVVLSSCPVGSASTCKPISHVLLWGHHSLGPQRRHVHSIPEAQCGCCEQSTTGKGMQQTRAGRAGLLLPPDLGQAPIAPAAGRSWKVTTAEPGPRGHPAASTFPAERRGCSVEDFGLRGSCRCFAHGHLASAASGCGQSPRVIQKAKTGDEHTGQGRGRGGGRTGVRSKPKDLSFVPCCTASHTGTGHAAHRGMGQAKATQGKWEHPAMALADTPVGASSPLPAWQVHQKAVRAVLRGWAASGNFHHPSGQGVSMVSSWSWGHQERDSWAEGVTLLRAFPDATFSRDPPGFSHLVFQGPDSFSLA